MNLVLVIDWVFFVLSFAGVAISAYTSYDAQKDLVARRKAGLNGDLEVSGRIARRGSLGAMQLHFGLLILGAFAVLPWLIGPAKLIGPAILGIVFILLQASSIASQIRNQIDRWKLRKGDK